MLFRSRAELYQIVLVRGITTFAELFAEHGIEAAGSEGCEVCKPAVAIQSKSDIQTGTRLTCRPPLVKRSARRHTRR